MLSLQPREAIQAPRPYVDVNTAYLKRYTNDKSFARAIDDYEALSRAAYDVVHGTPAQSFGGQLVLGGSEVAVGLHPGAGEYLDYEALTNPNAGLGSRILAGGSLLVSAITVGSSPNASTATRTFRVDTHTPNALLDAQRYTHQIDVLPNSHYYDPIDVYAGSNPLTRNDVLLYSTDPRVRPGYDPGTIQLDHEIAQVFGGTTTRPVPAGLNLRKGGLEGELRRYENYLINKGLDRDLAREVIRPEIESLSRDVIAAPFTSVYPKGFSIYDIDQ